MTRDRVPHSEGRRAERGKRERYSELFENQRLPAASFRVRSARASQDNRGDSAKRREPPCAHFSRFLDWRDDDRFGPSRPLTDLSDPR